MRPYINLAEKLGAFAGQLTETSISAIEVIYAGGVSKLNTKPLTAAAVAGVLKPMLSEINVINAPLIAKDRGIAIAETFRDSDENYESNIRLRVVTERNDRAVAGAIFGGAPKIIEVKGVRMEAGFDQHMLYTTNEDKPGFIGSLGVALGESEVNIGNFNLGRSGQGGEAIALISVDEAVSADVLEKVNALSHVRQAKALSF